LRPRRRKLSIAGVSDVYVKKKSEGRRGGLVIQSGSGTQELAGEQIISTRGATNLLEEGDPGGGVKTERHYRYR